MTLLYLSWLSAAWDRLACGPRRLEREADRIALDVTRSPEAFVSAMERLGQLNLAERRLNRVKEVLFATHPSLARRITMGRRWMESSA